MGPETLPRREPQLAKVRPVDQHRQHDQELVQNAGRPAPAPLSQTCVWMSPEAIPEVGCSSHLLEPSWCTWGG